MRIAVDAAGGDHGPAVVVVGAVDGARRWGRSPADRRGSRDPARWQARTSPASTSSSRTRRRPSAAMSRRRSSGATQAALGDRRRARRRP